MRMVTCLCAGRYGARHAFDILYNRYWKLVFNTAFKRLNDMERAQDITQDVFVQLWTSGTTTSIKNLPAYLNVFELSRIP